MTNHDPSPARRGCAAAVVGALLLAVAPSFADDGVVPFRSGAVMMSATDAERTTTDLATLAARPGGARHMLVRLDRTPTAADRRALDAQGLTVLRPLGGVVFFAALNDRFAGAPALVATGRIKSVAEVAPEFKLHPFLARGEFPQWAAANPGADDVDAENPRVAVYALFHPDVPLVPDALAIAAMHGGFVRSQLESVNGLVIEMPFSMIPQLALADTVQYIEPALPQFVELNDSNRGRTGADIAQGPPYSLDGSGVIVMVYDGGAALASHQDFGGRLTVRDSDGLSDHATHVSGTIGGDGAGSGGQYRGMAPGVQIESYGFEQEGGLQQGFLYTDPGDLEQDYTNAITVHNAVISNNSIGTNTAPNGFPCEWEGDYGVTSALIDSVVRGDLGAPMRIVWANGNERGSGACGTTYHTTAPPACAKNHITVGALNSNDDSMTSFSSWGPADDGRLKPDISGPGCQSNDDNTVTSCSQSGGYTGKCGTSMSSPTVCGISALIIQDYRIQYPSEPDFRNSMLKCFLAHTAEDVGNVGPDYQFGYGSVRVVPAIDLMRSGNFVQAEVSHGEVYSLLISVGPGDSQVKVTLAWDDAPGTPNVDPALVNDLDLEVFDDGGTQHFPWTLDAASPANPAVRTGTDHLNNIEQVVIDSPAPGIYRVDVRGFNIVDGPQPFSVTATPLLINCSSRGVVSLDKVRYPCEASALVKIVDCDLNTDDGVVETVVATIASDSEPGGESLLLTESGPETAEFIATIPLAGTDTAGTLLVAHGDTVTATYTDADDGAGGENIVVNSSSPVDCLAPVALSIQTVEIEARSAIVEILTDEPVQAIVRYGTSCGGLVNTSGSAQFRADHMISLSQLTENTTWFFEVELTDQAANSLIDDNGGQCYSFTTPDVPDHFTEEFGGDNDLDGWSVTYTPGHPADFYSACSEEITALPSMPGGNVLPLSDDDSEEVTLTLDRTVWFYGTEWSSFFVGSNGYITFGGGDTDYTESLGDHFSQPRISLIFDDFNPASAGAVAYRQLSDRVIVTWEGVPEYSQSDANNFQAELFFDGVIRTSWVGIDVSDGLSGLSEGEGVPVGFLESDINVPGNCNPPGVPGDANDDGVVDVNDINVIISQWGACPPEPAPCPGDLNQDGVVDVDDLQMVIAFWGTGGQHEAPAGRGAGALGVAAADSSPTSPAAETDTPESVSPPLPPMYVNDGWLAPADHEGLFAVGGGYRQTRTGTLAIDYTGALPVSEHDLLAARGPMMLDGTLEVHFADGFVPAPGARLPVLIGRSIDGRFGNVRVSPKGIDVRVVYGQASVALVVEGEVEADDAVAVVETPVSGDVDGRRCVSLADVFRLLDSDGPIDEPALAAALRSLP